MTTIDSISHKDLLHHKLQAILRDNNLPELSYVGVFDGEHVYNIAGNLVPISQIDGIDEV